MIRLLSFALILISLTACQEKITEMVYVDAPADEISTDNVKDTSNEKIRSEKLVSYAERMLQPNGFFFADEILDQALKADPENRKAQLYKAIIAPMVKFRGFLSKASLLRHKPQMNVFHRKMGVYDMAQGGLSQFLYSDAEPWKNENDVQKFLSELMVEQKKLLDFVKANRNFVVRIPRFQIFDYPAYVEHCTVLKLDATTYRVAPCPYATSVPLTANRADWEAVLQIWTGTRMMALFSLSYEMTGLFDNYKRLAPLGDMEAFGKLKVSNRLHEALGFGTDIYGGLRWLYSVRRKLCPSTQKDEGPEKRTGHIFEGSLCLGDQMNFGRGRASTVDALLLLHLSLTSVGGTLEFSEPVKSRFSDTEFSKVEMDLAAPFKGTIKDLKSVFPTEYNECGQPLGLRDPTLGGVFKSGNAAEFVLKKPIDVRQENGQCGKPGSFRWDWY